MLPLLALPLVLSWLPLLLWPSPCKSINTAIGLGATEFNNGFRFQEDMLDVTIYPQCLMRCYRETLGQMRHLVNIPLLS
jgi:hypothetical protein